MSDNTPPPRRIIATQPVAVVYHIDSEQPRMIIKSDDPGLIVPEHHYADNLDDHTHLYIHHDDYEKMDHDALHAHLSKHIPLHKASLKKEG